MTTLISIALITFIADKLLKITAAILNVIEHRKVDQKVAKISQEFEQFVMNLPDLKTPAAKNKTSSKKTK